MVITRKNTVRDQDLDITNQVSTSTQNPGPPHPGPPHPPASLSILNTIQDNITTLSEEGKVIVNTIVKVLQTLLESKDQKIDELQSRVKVLENKVSDLECQIDDVNQYERRDTIIVSGPSLPRETTNENPTEIVVNAIKANLKLNIDHTDINVAHRMGNKNKT